jgi:hypothetical protein
MGFTRSEFFGRPPLFLPGSWVLVLGVIAFCYSIVFIGIVFGDTENEHLKIAAFILLFASFIVSISGLSWNYYFYEKSNHESILRRAYGGYGNPFVRADENGRLIYIKINPSVVTNTTNNNNNLNPTVDPTAATARSLNTTNNNINTTATNIEINEATQ